ncbi:mannose-1-phosphate guanylyltransferase [Heyndrickxia coagulans]|uniref:sugar phosphate nucleotidyltransferase n=1 Tax=Heyndrickxia coagulans TaxID=1398 RepID=UPI000E522A75|nr:sugar phosphate nucleotidyltransferase [Heyndrickxia coagulans]RGR83288.1 mannose-1-phosphate guanylyltransferase [Heyndrickxia coagulans]
MKLVLLSGGSGKRLWPLSNNSRSKQFLKVLTDLQNNDISMIQRVWKQLQLKGLEHDSVIATSYSQVDMIINQLGKNVPIVIEPDRRDTFPAVALAASYLYSVQGCDKEEVLAMLPVDPYVEDGFFDKVKDLENAISTSNASLALIGVKPTYPSEKYGYIVPQYITNDVYVKVDYFKEKPKEALAKELIKKNALWNCGVFAFKLDYILNLLEENGFPTEYNQLKEQYHLIPKNSFDYEVVEKTDNIIVLPYDGYWKDLGTWNTLTEEMSSNVVGKGIISEEVINSNIINELDIPIALLGINNAVVAASPDGILVTDKEISPKVKDYVAEFNYRPMYEERTWGWYRVLDQKKYPDGNEVLTRIIGIDKGRKLSYQVHYKRTEIWTILKGSGILLLNDNFSNIKVGDTIEIQPGFKHGLLANENIELIEIQNGSELIEEDCILLNVEREQNVTK